MARTFSIDTAASPSRLLERARRAASENGVTLVGNEGSGRFWHKMLEGEYRLSGRTVIVTITHKHRLVPWSGLEGRLRALFGSSPSGMGRVGEKSTVRRGAGLVGGLLAGIHATTGICTVGETPLTLATTTEEGPQDRKHSSAFFAAVHLWHERPKNVEIHALKDNSPSLVHQPRRRGLLASSSIQRSRLLEPHASASSLRTPLL